jgi:UTP:GlnB (protein PII) uridylyltransferase
MKPYGASAMPEPSSPSVKVTFTNRKQILTALENLIQEWTQKHPELEQVFLFGSFARGDYFPGSDVDVLLILEKSDQPFLKRIPTFLPTPISGRYRYISLYESQGSTYDEGSA